MLAAERIGMSKRSRLTGLGLLLVSLLAAAFLLPGVSGPFLFDDGPNILTNNALHIYRLSFNDLLYAAYSFQPGHGSRALSMLSFAFDFWRSGGLDARTFKMTNLVIHVLTVPAVFGFLLGVLRAARAKPNSAELSALFLTLIWAIHPLQVSSVLYVVQRMQTLCTLFIVLALWSYVRMREAQRAGKVSRNFAFQAVLYWVMAFAAKEDAALFPLYVLVLEWTVFRFRATTARLSRSLRLSFLAFFLLGLAAFMLLVVPHYWTESPYPGRNFNTPQRLLSETRALGLYLSQILAPYPGSLRFYYDDFVVSQNLWTPVSTLWCSAGLLGLLIWAFCWRNSRPLFTLGIGLFFAGHLMTSTVIGLELVFEHRNAIPMLGLLLSAFELLRIAAMRWAVKPKIIVAFGAIAALLMGCITLRSAIIWGDEERLARELVARSPRSERAWLQLATIYAARAQARPGPLLAKSIALSEQGAQITNGTALLANLVVNKSIEGTVGPDDWRRFLTRLAEAPLSKQNESIVWMLMDNVDRGLPLDADGVARAIEIVAWRGDFDAYEHLRFAAFIYNRSRSPERALPHLRRAVAVAPRGDADIEQMLDQLAAANRPDWLLLLRAEQATKAN
ncbi:hypothetical protein [Lysobacter soyae]|uniref:Tetratricopeptide repeat protein n=1 Tax=Lysobacter soyae TaxID=2764185 RepID=A0ABX8WPA9_9GAMM|nr:hypothetical protein [Lysobacter sp. CJ11]QYR52661.1 hypothetical protein H8L67_08725 [Lysobacter sp. CJ11]